MFLGEGNERVTEVHAVDMEPYKLYNVKREAWHSHTFSADAKVLIVENRDTVDANSSFVLLSISHCAKIIALMKRLWK